MDRFKVYASTSTCSNGAGSSGVDHRPTSSMRCPQPSPSIILTDSLLPFGLPSLDTIEPQFDQYLRPFVPFRPFEPVAALSDFFIQLTIAESDSDADLCDLYLEQHLLLRCVNDQRILRKALRSARVHAVDVHRRLVISAWLRYDGREDEFGLPLNTYCPGHHHLYDSINNGSIDPTRRHREEGETHGDLWFLIREEEVLFVRSCIAALSLPLNALLYGGFAEAQRDRMNFTENGISIEAMKTVDLYSRSNQIENNPRLEIILELISFSNKFCCDRLNSICEARLETLVQTHDDPIRLIDQGLDQESLDQESAYSLVAACLQRFLRELPTILQNADVMRLFCSLERKERLEASGHASFVLYYFLSQVAMEEDFKSNITIMLLERLVECASSALQKQQALHQLGCVMLAREEYRDVERRFLEASKIGHVYSIAGSTRTQYKRGGKIFAHFLISEVLNELEPAGWMYQERSLYNDSREKMEDLNRATEMDPTIKFPYKYRAISLSEEGKLDAAIAEISKIIRFRVSPDCLELRSLFYLTKEDFEGAMQDLRALLTLDPEYCFLYEKVHRKQTI